MCSRWASNVERLGDEDALAWRPSCSASRSGPRQSSRLFWPALFGEGVRLGLVALTLCTAVAVAVLRTRGRDLWDVVVRHDVVRAAGRTGTALVVESSNFVIALRARRFCALSCLRRFFLLPASSAATATGDGQDDDEL